MGNPGEFNNMFGDSRLRDEQAARKKARRRRWGWALSLSLPVLTAGAAAYLFFTPQDLGRDIRCYYEADLTAIRPLPDSEAALPPYVVVGNMDKATEKPDPFSLCADVWEQGIMDPNPATPVPELAACTVENSVAVIPGRPEVCGELGIPAFES